MDMIKLSVDFSKVKTVDDFHNKMKELFGFPDFYGKNYHALIDCLSSLRYPDDGMTEIHINKDEYILLEINDVKYRQNNCDVINSLFSAIQCVNYRCKQMGDNPSILLLLTLSSH